LFEQNKIKDEKMKKSIKETVKDAILPTVTELGYRLWDITYAKIGADYHLEITIDKDGGIDIQDCERVHRAIDPILDEVDPIEGFYYLEVSSPGAERELRTDEHILASVGERVEAKLFAPKDGVKAVTGALRSYENGVVVITDDSGDHSLERSEISKLRTVYFD
jgi:ribosome maturation factor RimP